MHPRFDELTECTELERGGQIDLVCHFTDRGELGADFGGDARDRFREQDRQLIERIDDLRRAPQTLQPRGSDAQFERTSDAFGRVDVPAGRAFEPGSGVEGEAAAVFALERRFDERALGRSRALATCDLEIELGAEDFVGRPTKLHERGLEEHSPALELGDEIGGVVAAELEAASRIAALVTTEDAERLAVTGGSESLNRERLVRAHRCAHRRIDHHHGQSAGSDRDAELEVGESVDGNALGEPGVEPGPGRNAARRLCEGSEMTRPSVAAAAASTTAPAPSETSAVGATTDVGGGH